MIELNASIIAAFCLYLAVVMAIGIFAWRRTRDAHDYFIGGRSLSPFVTAFSAGASDMSGWVLIGLPGYAYVAGLEAGWMSLGLSVGVAVNWLVTARRLRVYTERLGNAVTLPSYLQRRFHDPGPWLRVVASVFILLFFLFYVSAGLIGGGKLFVAMFGMEYHLAVLLGAVVVIAYTLFGGFLAVSWTDVFQALLMTLALVVVPLAAMGAAGGPLAWWSGIGRINPELLDVLSDRQGGPLSAIAIASLLGWGLAYFGQPHILARFKAVRTPAMVHRAATIGILWSLLVYGTAVLVGMSGVAYLGEPLADPEKVFMALVGTLFHPLVAGVLLAAVLAAIMSTVDSQLLVCSSALAEDLWPVIAGDELDSDARLRLGRIAVASLSLVAVAVAMNPDSKVLDAVAYAWGGLGASIGPAVLLSLYWSRMTHQGALAGVLIGGLTVIIWKPLHGGLFDLYELIPGFVLSCAAIGAVSLLTAAPHARVREDFDGVGAVLRAAA